MATQPASGVRKQPSNGISTKNFSIQLVDLACVDPYQDKITDKHGSDLRARLLPTWVIGIVVEMLMHAPV